MRPELGLFSSQKFLPIFVAQFLGALNDNIFKSALLILIAFSLTNQQAQATATSNFAAILYIIPIFIVSYIAGQLADRSNKSRMIQKNKIAEITIAFMSAVALWSESTTLLLSALFLMGAQSAMFGPNKYAILPQLMQGRDLVQANAHIATGTFIAVLIGTVMGALLIQTDQAWRWVGLSMLVIATLGFLAAKRIPEIEVGESDLQIDWNPLSQIKKVVRIARLNKTFWLAILGVSWFWFVGTAYLTQLPALVRFIGGGDESVVTLFLILFVSGIALGCALSANWSGARSDIGIVPCALFGLFIAGIDFAIIPALPEEVINSKSLLSVTEFVGSWRGIHISFDVVLVGFFCGAFALPMFIELQHQTRRENRARMIALSNMLNALAMILSSSFALIMLNIFDVSLSSFLITVAILSGIITLFFGKKLLLQTFRFLSYLVCRCLYRIETQGLEKLPQTGAALLVCNHLSFADPPLIFGTSRRPIRFLMEHSIYQTPWIRWAFAAVGAIPMCSPLESRAVYRKAMETAIEALKNGEMVIIFPEGQVTRDGKPNPFKRGVEKILEAAPVTVYPVGITGLWGSMLSYKNGKPFEGLPAKPRLRVGVSVGEPINPEKATAQCLETEVRSLVQALEEKI